MIPRPSTPDAELPDRVEVVVVGAGHNSLVCAAYLARAGLQVLVLEASPTIGGNTRTEELTLPGFAHDSCSSAHVLIQSNPLIRDDELGLLAEQGLEYLTTDPAVVLPQADGDLLVVRPDLDATCDELARWSADDARAFRTMVETWRGGLAAAHGRWSSALPQPPGATTDAYLALRERSAWDVVHETFTHPVVRSFVLWMAMATIQDPRRPGTGFLPSSLATGRLDFGWTTPVGGSQALPEALARVIRAHGGQIVCSAPVASLQTGLTGVRRVVTASGHSVEATRAVVAGGHLAQLAGMITDSAATPDLEAAANAWQPGLSVFAVHAALRDDLRFGPSGITSAAAGYGTADGMARHIDRHNAGELDAEDPWLLAVDQTAVDKSRAASGATFKILTIAPWSLADGRSWESAKTSYGEALVSLVASRCEGLSESDILSIRYESPVDVAAHNPHNLGGSCHGGEFLVDGRVIPGWLRYDTDIPGLFVTGATTHPGGSVSGRPGRNAARTVLTSLGLDPLSVMGPG
jgi:phytoene dehydrogenase-like protein